MNLTECVNALRVMKNLIQTNARSFESIKMPTRNEKNIQALKVEEYTSILAGSLLLGSSHSSKASCLKITGILLWIS